MTLQEQLGKPQQPYASANLSTSQIPTNMGMLGNELSQAPTFLVIADIFLPFLATKTPGEGSGLGLAVAYGIVRQTDTSKLTRLKLQKFTYDDRERRIAASLAALNAPQPTKLSLAEWKEIIEEVEDDEA